MPSRSQHAAAFTQWLLQEVAITRLDRDYTIDCALVRDVAQGHAATAARDLALDSFDLLKPCEGGISVRRSDNRS